jgi:purine-binding chemotaxis protein CheW
MVTFSAKRFAFFQGLVRIWGGPDYSLAHAVAIDYAVFLPNHTVWQTLRTGYKMQHHQENQSDVELLAFTLGKEEYGIKIMKVQEIRGYNAVTTLANAPDFIKGVINLRGSIVPIIDMRIKFELGTPTYDEFTVVIILNLGAQVVGMVVDRVSDVITLTPAQIKPAPEMGTAVNTNYLIGLGTIDERMVIIVDIDKLMSSSEIGILKKLAA